MSTKEVDYRGHCIRMVISGSTVLGFEVKAHIIPQKGKAPVFILLKMPKLYPTQKAALKEMLVQAKNRIDDMLMNLPKGE